MNLGTLIKEEIKRQSKTQKEVAEFVGISTNAMSQICINATFPHKRTLEDICDYLDIEIEFSIKRIPSDRYKNQSWEQVLEEHMQH